MKVKVIGRDLIDQAHTGIAELGFWNGCMNV